MIPITKYYINGICSLLMSLLCTLPYLFFGQVIPLLNNNEVNKSFDKEDSRKQLPVYPSPDHVWLGDTPCGVEDFDTKKDAFSSLIPERFTINVIDLSFIPIVNGNVDVSQTGDWHSPDLSLLLKNIDDLRDDLIRTLEEGSTYHGYKDRAATPSLSYNIIEKKIFYIPMPASKEFLAKDRVPFPDHMRILNEINIRDYVENKDVKEVWIWMNPTPKVAGIESNMAGPYGDISNSYRSNDLPVCRKTYVVYDYNYGRSVSMAVENHTHQIEAVLNNVDRNLFWDLFVGRNGSGRCGWTHYPPNGRADYDWNNTTPVLSDCENWKPDGSGEKKETSCRTWSVSQSGCDNDEGLSFKKWWMQNIPGKDNNLYFNGKKLKNWWIFIGDFDNAMRSKRLTYDWEESPMAGTFTIINRFRGGISFWADGTRYDLQNNIKTFPKVSDGGNNVQLYSCGWSDADTSPGLASGCRFINYSLLPGEVWEIVETSPSPRIIMRKIR